MIEVKVFIDTNILVYAYDRDAGVKHERAATLVEQLWNSPLLPALSIQVLQEFYVNLIKKSVQAKSAEKIVSAYFDWDLVDNDRAILTAAFTEQRKFNLSFWDSCILAAARRSYCVELWSEDFNTGQIYDGVKAVNPLR